MFRRLRLFFSEWGKEPPRAFAETPPYLHELIEAGFKNPVIYLDPWDGWSAIERDLAELYGYEFKEPPVYGW